MSGGARRRYIRLNGMPPTVREIADYFGFKSPKAASDHLTALEKKGKITRRYGMSRNIQLRGDARIKPTDDPRVARLLETAREAVPAVEESSNWDKIEALDEALLDLRQELPVAITGMSPDVPDEEKCSRCAEMLTEDYWCNNCGAGALTSRIEDEDDIAEAERVLEQDNEAKPLEEIEKELGLENT